MPNDPIRQHEAIYGTPEDNTPIDLGICEGCEKEVPAEELEEINNQYLCKECQKKN